MKKNIYIYLMTLLGFLFLWGCNKDYEAPSPEYAYPVITTTRTTVNIGGDISFADIGMGTTTRLWSFPEGVDILGSDIDTESSDKVVHAAFTIPGEHTVHFHGDYVGSDSVVLDSAIIVTVLDSITAALSHNHSDIKNVEAGSTVQFSDVSTGDPDTWEWIIDGGDPATSAEANPAITFKKLGTFDVKLIASRVEPFGRDTLHLKDFITVIPSSEPVTVVGLTATREDVIQVQYSRELQAFTGEEGNFKVMVAGTQATVNKVVLSASNASLVEITVDEEIYNTDQVLVTYADGNLTSTDFVEANKFSNVEVAMWMPNYAAKSSLDTGFENGGIGWKLSPWWQSGSGTLSVDGSAAHTGDTGLMIAIDAGGRLGAFESDLANQPISLEAGLTYKLSYWINVVERGGMNEMNIRILATPWSQVARIWYGGGNLDKSGWQKVETVFTLAADDARDLENLKIAFQNAPGSETEVKMMIDDVSIVPWEERP